jgi:CO/xanthine dehydrogenase Mo-binding subunit
MCAVKRFTAQVQKCLKKVAEWIEWGKPSVQPAEKHIKVAKGIALGNKYTMADTASTAEVKVHFDGTAEAFHGGDDCGQGLHTVVAQIVAEELSMPMEKVKVIYGDTARVPYDFGTASSRSTIYIGNAVRLAAIDARKQIFNLAAPLLNTTADNLILRDGKISVKDAPGKVIDLMDLTLGRQQPIGMIRMATCLEEGAEISGKATFWGRPSDEDHETGQGERLTISYAYGAQAAEVAVDTETGNVRVLRLASAFDTGVTIHPAMCEAQIEGGAAMGLGCALYEGLYWVKTGRYAIPTCMIIRFPALWRFPAAPILKHSW